ncbi:plasminogen receptor (KT)-like [Oscarella lobularis]|uniref:plasminogen receptor (KT)-like n=1 Tax=Oscarella lobularis TaxID=121494 RepID=UPI0033140771
MGSITSKMDSVMSENMEKMMDKQKEVMESTQTAMLKRQIQMQMEIRDRMVAAQVAMGREQLYWYGSFYTLAALGMIRGFSVSKKPAVLAPLLPLTFVLGYLIDLNYYTKRTRVIAMAEGIMTNERALLGLPQGPPTVEAIDKKIQEK